MDQEQMKSEKRDRQGWKLLVLCLLVIILVLSAMLCAQLLRKPDKIIAGDLFPELGDAEPGHLPQMTREEILEQMQKVVDASYFSFKINARPVLKDGALDLNIENPSYNTYPMVVTIYLTGTEELIYNSGGILPDYHIAEARLLKELPVGIHSAEAHLHAYDPETGAFLGKSAAALQITVE